MLLKPRQRTVTSSLQDDTPQRFTNAFVPDRSAVGPHSKESLLNGYTCLPDAADQHRQSSDL